MKAKRLRSSTRKLIHETVGGFAILGAYMGWAVLCNAMDWGFLPAVAPLLLALVYGACVLYARLKGWR